MTDNRSSSSKEYLMYMHAGSGNHGCEAIVRSLTGILGGRPVVLSNNPGEDERAGLGDICDVIPTRHYEDSLILRTGFYIRRRLTGRGVPSHVPILPDPPGMRKLPGGIFFTPVPRLSRPARHPVLCLPSAR